MPACLSGSVRKVAHRLFQDGQTAEVQREGTVSERMVSFPKFRPGV